jgi:hypothetical protein
MLFDYRLAASVGLFEHSVTDLDGYLVAERISAARATGLYTLLEADGILSKFWTLARV